MTPNNESWFDEADDELRDDEYPENDDDEDKNSSEPEEVKS